MLLTSLPVIVPKSFHVNVTTVRGRGGHLMADWTMSANVCEPLRPSPAAQPSHPGATAPFAVVFFKQHPHQFVWHCLLLPTITEPVSARNVVNLMAKEESITSTTRQYGA
jgi:hypothetical protein